MLKSLSMFPKSRFVSGIHGRNHGERSFPFTSESLCDDRYAGSIAIIYETDLGFEILLLQYYSYEATGRQTMTEKAKLSIRKQCACTTENLKKLLFALLPVCQWLPKYNLNKLLKDVIPGLTIGVMQIPQGKIS